MSVYQLVTYVLFILRIWRINAKFIRGTSLTNWADAKEFCDEEYEGIATINDAIELAEAQTECFKEGFSAMGCWIGLSAVIKPEDSTIVDWQLYGPGIPDTANWGYHRGLAVGNEIYLIGATADAWVLDLDTQMWTTDNSVDLSAIGFTSGSSQNGQFGAVINGAYYFLSIGLHAQIQKYVPGDSLHSNFATHDGGEPKCFTANEDANILYVMGATDFEYLNVTAVSPTVSAGNDQLVSSRFAQCAYIDGYVYVFGDQFSDAISKINVGVNNEHIDTAEWEVLTTTMPVIGIQRGEAVVAANGKIYIGGFVENNQNEDVCCRVLEFNPADETITDVASFNVHRPYSAFIYVESLDQICAISGAEDPGTTDALDSWECSNVLSSGGTCTWSWDDMTAVDFGFNDNDATDPTTGEAPWYIDQPDGCGDSISNENCAALGASGACEKLFDDVNCNDTNQLPLCYSSATDSPTASPTDNSNNPTNSPTMDSDDSSSDEAENAFYGYENLDKKRNAKNEGVTSEDITVNLSISTVLNIFGIICGLLFIVGFISYCFCVKDTNPIFTSDV